MNSKHRSLNLLAALLAPVEARHIINNRILLGEIIRHCDRKLTQQQSICSYGALQPISPITFDELQQLFTEMIEQRRRFQERLDQLLGINQVPALRYHEEPITSPYKPFP